MADQLADARDRLGNLTTDGWSGVAAEAFLKAKGELPGQLDHVFQAYDHLAWTFWQFENQKRELMQTSNTAAESLQDALYRLHVLRAQRDETGDSSMDPQIELASSEVQAAQARCHAAREEFGSLCFWAKAQIDYAAGPIANTFVSTLGQLGSDLVQIGSTSIGAIGNVIGGAVGFVGTIVQSVAKAVHDLPGLVADFAHHPTLDNFVKMVKDAGTVVSFVALFIPGIGGLAIILDVATFAGDTAKAMLEGASWHDVLMDGLSVATDGVGAVAARAASMWKAPAAGERMTFGAGEHSLLRTVKSQWTDGAAIHGIETSWTSFRPVLINLAHHPLGTIKVELPRALGSLRHGLVSGSIGQWKSTFEDASSGLKAVGGDLAHRFAGGKLPVSTAVQWTKGISAFAGFTGDLKSIADLSGLDS